MALPPPQIGRIISAHNAVNQSEISVKKRLIITFAILTSTLSLAWTIHHLWPAVEQFPYHGPFLSLLGILGAAAFWMNTRPRGVCTFVGELGLARSTCGGCFSRSNTDILLFSNAALLEKQRNLTDREERLLNNNQTPEACSFTWRNHEGHPLFTIHGTLQEDLATPNGPQDFLFACAAEEIWSRHQLYECGLHQNQPVTFPLIEDGAWLRLEPDQLTIQTENGVESFRTLEIEAIWQDEDASLTFVLSHGSTTQTNDRRPVRLRLQANELLFLTLLEAMTGLKAESRDPKQVVTRHVRDPLTGLPGAILFQDHLEMEVARHRQNHNAPFIVLVIKFDNLTRINHCIESKGGCQTVTSLANRLRESIPDPQAIARLSEAEFGVILEQDSKETQLTTLRRHLSAVIQTSAGMVKPRIAIGSAHFPEAGETAFALLCSARKAAITGLLGAFLPEKP